MRKEAEKMYEKVDKELTALEKMKTLAESDNRPGLICVPRMIPGCKCEFYIRSEANMS